MSFCFSVRLCSDSQNIFFSENVISTFLQGGDFIKKTNSQNQNRKKNFVPFFSLTFSLLHQDESSSSVFGVFGSWFSHGTERMDWVAVIV